MPKSTPLAVAQACAVVAVLVIAVCAAVIALDADREFDVRIAAARCVQRLVAGKPWLHEWRCRDGSVVQR